MTLPKVWSEDHSIYVSQISGLQCRLSIYKRPLPSPHFPLSFSILLSLCSSFRGNRHVRPSHAIAIYPLAGWACHTRPRFYMDGKHRCLPSEDIITACETIACCCYLPVGWALECHTEPRRLEEVFLLLWDMNRARPPELYRDIPNAWRQFGLCLHSHASLLLSPLSSFE